jgi:MFS family permease
VHPFFKGLLMPLLALIIFVFGAGYFATFNTLYLKEIGATDQVIGIMQSSFFAGMLVGSCFSDRLIVHLGHAGSFALACFLAAGAVLAMGCCSWMAVWLTLRFICGLAVAIVYVVIESWLLAAGHSDHRGRIIAFYMVALYAAQSSSQYLLELLQGQFTASFMLTGTLMMLSIIPLIGRGRNLPHHQSTVPMRINTAALFRMAPFGVLAGAFSGMLLAAVYSFAPLFAVEHGIPVSQLMSLTIWGGVLCQWPIGRLSDRMDRQLLLCGTCILMAVACLVILMSYEWASVVLLASLLLGGCAFTIYPQSIVIVVSEVKTISVTTITAIQAIAYSIGSMIGPLIVPLFTLYWGMLGLYIFMGSAATLFCLIGVWNLQMVRSRRAIGSLNGTVN